MQGCLEAMTDPRKPIFNEIRKANGGSLSRDDVAIIDAALDHVGIPKGMQMASNSLGSKGEALIKKWEGYAKDLGNGQVQSYPDPATGGAPWTIGWGTTGPDVTKGTIWSQEKALNRFREHVATFAAGVSKALDGAPATANQFDAMVSLAYNVGLGNFTGSTLLKKHKAKDYAGAAAEFSRWNKAGGKVMAGLTNRRAEEAKLYAS